MAKFIDIQMIGDKELQRKLRELPIAMERKIVRKALREAARPVLAAAKALAPVLTGRMKAGMKLRAEKAKRGHFGVQVVTPTRKELGIAGDDPYYYPMAVEVGTAKMPAHPFMRPALDANREKGIAIAAREIRAGIEAEARRG